MFAWMRPRRAEPPVAAAEVEVRGLDFTSMPWLAGFPVASGVSVSASNAMTSPTTAACVRGIGETVGHLPFKLFQRGADGSRDSDDTHAASNLVHGWATPWQSVEEFRAALTVDALLTGSGFALVSKVRGRVVELHRLPPSSVAVEIDEVSREPVYKISEVGGGTRTFGWADVLHLSVPGGAIDRPLNLITIGREAIGLEIALLRHQARLFGNSSTPGGLLTLPSRGGSGDGPDRLKAFREIWESTHGASGEGTGKTAVLPEGTTWTQVTLNPVDAQFLELRKFAVEEICRLFRLPPIFAQDLSRAVWNTTEQSSINFVQFCLLPWLNAWEAAYTRVLLSPRERASYYIESMTGELLKADVKSQMEALRNAVGGAFLVPDEARRLLNYPPVDGGAELVRQAGVTGAGDTAPTPAAANNEAPA